MSGVASDRSTHGCQGGCRVPRVAQPPSQPVAEPIGSLLSPCHSPGWQDPAPPGTGGVGRGSCMYPSASNWDDGC